MHKRTQRRTTQSSSQPYLHNITLNNHNSVTCKPIQISLHLFKPFQKEIGVTISPERIIRKS